VQAKLRELEAENASLRERVSQLDERNNSLAKEIVRAKFRGQQQQVRAIKHNPGVCLAAIITADKNTDLLLLLLLLLLVVVRHSQPLHLIPLADSNCDS
jgi:hypothetical protein